MDNLSKLPERSLIPQGGRGDKERTVVFSSFHPLFFQFFSFSSFFKQRSPREPGAGVFGGSPSSLAVSGEEQDR